jgi:hypothetical protein
MAINRDALHGVIEALQQVLREEATQTTTPVETAVRQPRKGRKRSLCSRVKMSQSWSPARRAARAKSMREYWQLERATRPDHPNGSCLID